ncbi:hypothetical protein VO63_17710 [Streptomyces showdoensis]|uniref:Uncharacterized protein n=1 Tax=Streptomyces showdoensis TaxID=68268 RepID=A0A2P2GM35_STREW|nr:hypothetical protein VO63_17710 [Streptomyces showdoensis]
MVFADAGVELRGERGETSCQSVAFVQGHVVDRFVQGGFASLADALEVPLSGGGEAEDDFASAVRAGEAFEEADGLEAVAHAGDVGG